MGRYWKLLSIAVVILISIGTFYIQKTIAGDSYPDFKFQTEKGKATEIKSVTLVGNYTQGMNGGGVLLDSERTLYSSELSYIEQMNNTFYTDPSIKKLQKEYRSFMRGKEWAASLLTESDKVLAYADVERSNFSNTVKNFDIQVLNKETEEKIAITPAIPNHDQYNYINVEDVSMVDDTLKIVTTNYLQQNSEGLNNEIHIYHIDFKQKKVSNDKVVYTNKTKEQESNGMYSINQNDIVNNSGYTLFMKQTFKHVDDGQGNTYEEIIGSELLAVDLNADEVMKVNIPQDLGYGGDPSTIAVFGSKVYMPKQNEKGYQIVAFDIQKPKADAEIIKQITTSDNMELPPPLLKVHKEKLFIVQSVQDVKSPVRIKVIDIADGSTLYEGTIMAENRTTGNANYDMYIHDFYVN